jgi:hypothetical protein
MGSDEVLLRLMVLRTLNGAAETISVIREMTPEITFATATPLTDTHRV